MPSINTELTDAEAGKLDIIAKRQKRARKHAVAILVMERIEEILECEPITDDEIRRIEANLAALRGDDERKLREEDEA